MNPLNISMYILGARIMLFKNQSKMAAVKMANNIFKTFENSS